MIMAGHSKWKNIQHRKRGQDAKRGKVFTKLIREITVAARTGGGDPAANPRLRTAIDKALSCNMTRDTIDRAVKRGAGHEDDSEMLETRYEGYGVAGVAVMVDCLTDNKNRTVGDVRHAFSKCGGNLGTDGSVAYLFSKTGLISFEPGSPEDRILEVALNAGANDVVTNTDGSIDVLTEVDEMVSVKEALIDAGFRPANAEITMLASVEVAITDLESAQKLAKLTDMLEDLDDVQQVYTNADIDEALFSQLG